MAELLFITPKEMAGTTVMGGNIDRDKFTFCIANAQITTVEPLLGSELYDKIVADVTNGTLVDEYLFMYENYIKPITKNTAVAEYIEISVFTLANNGLFKHSPENSEAVTRSESEYLSGKYRAMAQMYAQRFEKYICKNSIKEYKTYQDEVNANDVKITGGWKL